MRYRRRDHRANRPHASAGVGIIAAAIGLGAPLEYLGRLGVVNVAAHEHALIEYATDELLRARVCPLFALCNNQDDINAPLFVEKVIARK